MSTSAWMPVKEDDASPWKPVQQPMNPAPVHDMQPAPTGIRTTLGDLENDLRGGGGRTMVGRGIGYLQGRGNKGMSGLESGVGPGVANEMGSVPLGLTKMAQGVAETPQHPIMGPVHAIGGALQAGSIPMQFMAGPGMESAIESIPSRTHAGAVLQDIRTAAKDVPVNPTRTMPEVQRFEELTERGGRRAKPLTQLYNRVAPSDVPQEPMMFPEARDFYTNVGDVAHSTPLQKLMGRGLKPTMRAQAVNVRRGLGSDITEAADTIGRGEDYTNAMREYANAMKLRKAAIGGGILLGGEALRRLPAGKLIGGAARTISGGGQ